MNITKEQLKQIIKEELEAVQEEYGLNTVSEQETLDEASMGEKFFRVLLALGIGGVAAQEIYIDKPRAEKMEIVQAAEKGDMSDPAYRAQIKHQLMKDMKSPDGGFKE